jgi:hypothetical protein
VRDCRAWAHEVAASGREVLASAYAYLVRQLKYPDTNKVLAQRLLQSVKKAFYATYEQELLEVVLAKGQFDISVGA